MTSRARDHLYSLRQFKNQHVTQKINDTHLPKMSFYKHCRINQAKDNAPQSQTCLHTRILVSVSPEVKWTLLNSQSAFPTRCAGDLIRKRRSKKVPRAGSIYSTHHLVPEITEMFICSLILSFR